MAAEIFANLSSVSSPSHIPLFLSLSIPSSALPLRVLPEAWSERLIANKTQVTRGFGMTERLLALYLCLSLCYSLLSGGAGRPLPSPPPSLLKRGIQIKLAADQIGAIDLLIPLVIRTLEAK